MCQHLWFGLKLYNAGSDYIRLSKYYCHMYITYKNTQKIINQTLRTAGTLHEYLPQSCYLNWKSYGSITYASKNLYKNKCMIDLR